MPCSRSRCRSTAAARRKRTRGSTASPRPGRERPGGTGSTFYTSPMTAQETSVSLSGHAAEFQMSGVVNNVIPKEGSNRFLGSAYVTYNDENTASEQLLRRAEGRAASPPSRRRSSSRRSRPASAARFGRTSCGSISAMRDSNVYRYLANLYVPPIRWRGSMRRISSRPAVVRNEDQNYSTRLTWQANPEEQVQRAISNCSPTGTIRTGRRPPTR